MLSYSSKKDVYAGIKSALDVFLKFQQYDVDLRILVMGLAINEKELVPNSKFSVVDNREDNVKYSIVDASKNNSGICNTRISYFFRYNGIQYIMQIAF